MGKQYVGLFKHVHSEMCKKSLHSLQYLLVFLYYIKCSLKFLMILWMCYNIPHSIDIKVVVTGFGNAKFQFHNLYLKFK